MENETKLREYTYNVSCGLLYEADYWDGCIRLLSKFNTNGIISEDLIRHKSSASWEYPIIYYPNIHMYMYVRPKECLVRIYTRECSGTK